MSLKARVGKLERQLERAAEDCPTCRRWCAIVGRAEDGTPAFRTCPACGRFHSGVVIVMDGFDSAWAE